MKHKHYDVIIAYAEGSDIQFYNVGRQCWEDCIVPRFYTDELYRVKPNVIRYRRFLYLLDNKIKMDIITEDDYLKFKLYGILRWIDHEWREVEV